MSMDPPARQSRTRDTPTRDRYAMSIPRDTSVSPTRSPFRMRTSLTPQPTGPTFGPTLHRYREHASEPPTLEELMEKPMFVRPPPLESSHQRNNSGDSGVTLGSLVDSQRSTRSPVRQHSALLFGPQGSDGLINARPINAAEKALHELDIYKTPLLPSRLRGSTTIPDMFKPKPRRSHTPTLMHSGKDEKPRLGKTKGREVNGTKPYAGEGGLKKLLARRRQEEEEERKKDKAEAMDDGRDEEDEVPQAPKQYRLYKAEPLGEKADLITEKRQQQDAPPTVPRVSTFGSSISPAKYDQSSLRVGRTRTSRNHISRPASRSNNRFSAVYDDEESDDQMLEEKSTDLIALEEAAKKVPVFEVPAGFSFAKEAPQIRQDLTDAKEPPVSSLPFSFTKPGTTNGPAASSLSPHPLKELEQAPKPPSSVFAQPAPPSDATQAPSITLTTATREPHKVAAVDAPVAASIMTANSDALKRPPSVTAPMTTGPGVPNFFANSVALSKSASISPPPTSSSLPNFFTNSAGVDKAGPMAPPQTFSPAHAVPTKDTENPLWEGEKIEKPALRISETKPFSFGDVHEPTSSPLLFGVSPAGTTNSSIFAGSGTSHATSIFGPSAAPAPVKEVETAPAASAFGGVPPPKPTEPTPSPFSFGAPTKADEPTQHFAAGPEPSKVPEIAAAPLEAAKPPPLFGGAPVSSFAGFGGLTAGATTSEVSKPAFSFGQPTSGAATPVEAPKPLFRSESAGGFSFGQRPSSAPTLDARLSPANPFSFGATPSTPPAGAEKKAPFTFGPLPVTAAPAASPAFSFGPPSGSSHGTDVSHKPFAYGSAAAAPTRPVTPPKNEQEFRMEESPTRDINGKAAEAPKPALGSFSFGAPSVSSTGSPLFSQNNQGGQGSSSPFSFAGAPGASAPNPFAAKPEEKQENKGLGFGAFGQNAPASAFSFRQPAEAVPTTPTSTSGFSFGPAPVVAATNTSTSFAFGGPPNNSNPFTQSASNAESAPNSPSTFNQSTPFSFTSPTAPSNPFAFGSSQPVSPVTNGNTSLPQAPSTPGGGFAFGQSSGVSAPQTTSPFQAPAALPPVGGSLFTIGAPPPPAPSGGGGRAIKKLPNRRIQKR